MEAKRSKRIPSGTKLSISFLLLAVALVVLTLVIVATNPSSKSPKTKASSSTSTTAPSIVATLSNSDPVAAQLKGLIANLSNQEAAAASSAGVTYNGYIVSPAVLDGTTPIALAAFSYDPKSLNVKIFTYQSGSWSISDQLSRPQGLEAQANPSYPWMVTGSYSPGITVGDVTQNGEPSFMIPLLFADNIPGSFVIQTSPTSLSRWHYANFNPSNGAKYTDVLARNPKFSATEIISSYDNCTPNCASGKTTQQFWHFDPGKQEFVLAAS
ncbi:MAG: hypothetical protein M0T78_06025 [Actinomycetota bacterium]|nr:hypothetical protein [Actinomycetota bacterium]